MASKRFVSIGECMIEMSGGDDRLYRLGFAGDTLNTAWYARALLPADWSVDYVTALGDDLYSAQMREFIGKAGIGTAHIQEIKAKRPGLYMIHQADGDRHFTYWRGQSAAKLLADDAEALDAALDAADIVYFSGITMAILAPRARGRLMKAIVKARNGGARVVFDTNIRPVLWTSPEIMQAVLTSAASISDIVLPTHSDEAPFFGDRDITATAERYLGLGVEEVIVKDGSNPALVATAELREHVSAGSGLAVVDATGAGDSFNSGYLSARIAGASPVEAAQRAHAVAGVVIGHKGALVAPELLDRA
ncbi:sugar kinase [Arsenicitalea aurantiaca]|uniref:Sugar kinase n=1 Tax=Arsenicitalea aurantiaca TaxID=1783274 RepID=A0A433XBD4_9HYPH|nr:sugar kinase [Arsenicitalea aurantiaca]RUT31340.1 sugar kinase [Arsenicitalea aurantiaca]